MQFQIQIQTKFRFQIENHDKRFKNAINAHVKTLWKVNMEHKT